MLIYGLRNECLNIFEPAINIIMNMTFILSSLFLLINGYTDTIIPIIMFVFSIIISHLSDTTTKILTIANVNQMKLVNISYYSTIFSFLLWYIGSYILMINLVNYYGMFMLFYGCLLTLFYVVVLASYFFALACLNINNYLNYHNYYR